MAGGPASAIRFKKNVHEAAMNTGLLIRKTTIIKPNIEIRKPDEV
jgi:hypothetical protein